jgi:hypothetical protein
LKPNLKILNTTSTLGQTHMVDLEVKKRKEKEKEKKREAFRAF